MRNKMLLLSFTFKSFLPSSRIKLLQYGGTAQVCKVRGPVSCATLQARAMQGPGVARHLLGPWWPMEVWQPPGMLGLWASAQQEPLLSVCPVAKPEGGCEQPQWRKHGGCQCLYTPQREHWEQQHGLINLNNLNLLFLTGVWKHLR